MLLSRTEGPVDPVIVPPVEFWLPEALPRTSSRPVATVVLFQTMPLGAPVEDTLSGLNEPSALTRLSAIPVAEVTLTSATVRPVAELALRPWVVPVTWMFRPRTPSLVSMSTFPWTVGRVPPNDGRAMVLAGGATPKRTSNVVPVTPWPMSFSLGLRTIPVLTVPEYTKMLWPPASTAAAPESCLNGLLSRPSPGPPTAGLTNQITGPETVAVAVALTLHAAGPGLPVSQIRKVKVTAPVTPGGGSKSKVPAARLTLLMVPPAGDVALMLPLSTVGVNV